jgi:DUF4097 and DUF4098 domain-containing protein YvlB
MYDDEKGRGGEPRAPLERSFETPGAVSLRVENAAGEVEIETQDATRTDVRLVALHPAADELVARARIVERSTGSGHEVTVEIPNARGKARFWLGDKAAVGVSVRVPAGTELDVSTASATVSARGRYRTADVRTASGEVGLEEVSGQVKVRTASGDIELGSAGEFADVETASGDVRIGVVAAGGKIATASGDVELGRVDMTTRVVTASGDVRLKEALFGANIATASGDQRIDRAAAGDLVLRAASGDIAVAVVPGSLIRFDASSISGEVASDIDVQADRLFVGNDGDVAELSIQAKTLSGDISVVRAAS